MKQINLVAAVMMVVWLWGCASPSERRSPKAWQGIVNGMTRADVHRVIGTPDAPRVSPFQEIWVTREWELDVDYNRQGRVTNVVQQYLLR